MISLSSLINPSWREPFQRSDIERKLALVLTVLAIIAGLATYLVISPQPPYGSDIRTVIILLNLDLVLLLLLGAVVARRFVSLVLQRRRGSAGSKLHTRLVALFSIVAVTPAILVSIFAVVFLSSGLETWFSSRIRASLDNSLAVAEAYLAEHKDVIRADALAMAQDLNREGERLLRSASYMRHVLVAQASMRALTEALIFEPDGEVLAHSGLAVALSVDQVPADAVSRAAAGEVVTLVSDNGDRVRALLRLDALGEAFLYVGRFVDPNVITFMERTQRIVAEYRQLESERSGIQVTSSLIFGIVALLLLLAAVMVGLNLADRLATPIGRLIAAADRVRAGDLMARVPEADERDEFGMLARAFNRMTSQLETQRRELMSANRQLDERRRFIETVLSGVTAGILGLDAERRVMLANSSASRLLGTPADQLDGFGIERSFPEIAPLIGRLKTRGGDAVDEQISITRGDQLRTLLVRVAPQYVGSRLGGYVVSFDDISALLSAQREAAWAEIARRIAHEIKNPLTPIRLSAERLNRRYLAQIAEDDRQSFGRSVQTIVQQVDVIGRLITEFSNFARMPAAVLRRENLNEIVQGSVFLQEQAWPSITFSLEIDPETTIEVMADAEKLRQVMTNILQNAIDALNEQPAEARDAPARIIVRCISGKDRAIVEIEDNGPGLPAEHRDRLLEPYVTTRAKGTGLGLAIVRKIMEEHQGSIELQNAGTGGALVRLVVPLLQES